VKGVTGSISGGFLVVATLLLIGAWMVARLRRVPALAIWPPVLPAAELT